MPVFLLPKAGNRRNVLLVATIALTYALLNFVHRTKSNSIPNQEVDAIPLQEQPSLVKTSFSNHQIIEWRTSSAIPQTVMLKHMPGFSIFDNIYMWNKTWFIVTDHPSSFPPVREIINNGRSLDVPEDEREPTDDDMQIISPRRARKLFGDMAMRASGTTFSTNEHRQFVNHYYHFAAEITLGLWRLYTTLDPNITPHGKTSLPPVTRWLFPHIPKGQWRDYTGMVQFFMAAAFPDIVVWGQEEWEDRAASGLASKFDRLVLTERGCVEKNTDFSKKEGKFAAIPFRLPSGPNWWAPIRWNVLSYIGMGEKEIMSFPSKPVIMYISRQGSGRRLIDEDHERLVAALQKMEKDYGYEVYIPKLEHMTRADQIALAARTTILMGVHGNGLTHMLWMQKHSKASVFEFYIPEGYALDYAWPASALGLTHYGFWNDTYFDREHAPGLNMPKGFHSSSIPIHAETVVKLCVDILSK